MKNIIVVVGMCGVGKTVACNYLEQKGFKRIYFGDITFERLAAVGLDATPENEKMMREKLRKENGMGVFATLNLPKIKEAAKISDVVLESLYSWEELKIVQEAFPNHIIIIAIVADKKLRYERLSTRDIRPFSKEEAIARDISEIENISKAGPIAYADFFIDNNGTIIQLEQQLDNILAKIKKD